MMKYAIARALVVFLSVLFIAKTHSQGIVQSDTVLHRIQSVQILDDSLSNQNLKTKYYQVIDDEGDTLILAGISTISISSPRKFANTDEYLKYLKYKRYAALVYPYAKEAIRIFREAEYVTQTMKKRKRKKYLKKLSEELEKEFEQPLSKLSKTQGKIMIKMIEKELEQPMFDLVKQTRGKWKAFYWNQFSKLYGYRLKDGYNEGDNPILDIVLQDFDISHTIAEK